MAYVPLWGCIVLVAALNIDIIYRIQSSLNQGPVGGTDGSHQSSRARSVSSKTRKEFIRLIVICVMYAVVHVPASYVRVMGAMNKVVEPKLNMIMVLAFAISLPLPGILNFFIWVVSDEQVINDWLNLFGLRSLSPFKMSVMSNYKASSIVSGIGEDDGINDSSNTTLNIYKKRRSGSMGSRMLSFTATVLRRPSNLLGSFSSHNNNKDQLAMTINNNGNGNNANSGHGIPPPTTKPMKKNSSILKINVASMSDESKHVDSIASRKSFRDIHLQKSSSIPIDTSRIIKYESKD